LSATASSLRVACHNKAGVTYPLPEAYGRRIAAQPHVEAVAAESWFGGIYHEVSDQFPNLAYDPDQMETIFPDWEISRQEAADFKRLRTAALVGPATMQRFHWHVGQQIVLRGTLYPFNVTLTIVGKLGGKAWPDFLIFRRDYLEELAGRPGFVDNYWVKVDKPESVPVVIAELDESFANSAYETRSESEASFLGDFLSSYRQLFRMAEVFGFIVVITIGLVAANTAAMSFRERRREVAVMRSMGFGSGFILSILLAESILIGLAGGLLGCGAAYLVLRLMVVATPALGPLGVISMPSGVLVESLIVAALIGLLSGLIPARSAARQNIVDALRVVA